LALFFFFFYSPPSLFVYPTHSSSVWWFESDNLFFPFYPSFTNHDSYLNIGPRQLPRSPFFFRFFLPYDQFASLVLAASQTFVGFWLHAKSPPCTFLSQLSKHNPTASLLGKIFCSLFHFSPARFFAPQTPHSVLRSTLKPIFQTRPNPITCVHFFHAPPFSLQFHSIPQEVGGFLGKLLNGTPRKTCFLPLFFFSFPGPAHPFLSPLSTAGAYFFCTSPPPQLPSCFFFPRVPFQNCRGFTSLSLHRPVSPTKKHPLWTVCRFVFPFVDHGPNCAV